MPLYISICGTFLLVYTADNVLNIYSIQIRSENVNSGLTNGNGTASIARLERIRRVAFVNIVARASRVRGISLFTSYNGGTQIHVTPSRSYATSNAFIDQMATLGDVISAHIMVLVDGKLIMLSPRIPVSCIMIVFHVANKTDRMMMMILIWLDKPIHKHNTTFIFSLIKPNTIGLGEEALPTYVHPYG